MKSFIGKFFAATPAIAAACILAATIPAAVAQTGRAADPRCILDRCGDRPDLQRQAQRSDDRRNRRYDRRDNRRSYDRRDRRRDFDRRDRRSRGNDRRGGQRYGSTPGKFDFYVLALSWSPTYCASPAGRRSRNQCRIGAGLRFVVHGLWPQFDRGSPSYCNESNPPRSAVEQAKGVFPELGLARYQWRKHGSCSGLAPSAYFRAVAEARGKIVIPPALAKLDKPSRADPNLIEKAFLAANKNLRPNQIAVTCRDGGLQEVRICMTRDLRGFTACPEVDRRACRASSVTIPPPR